MVSKECLASPYTRAGVSDMLHLDAAKAASAKIDVCAHEEWEELSVEVVRMDARNHDCAVETTSNYVDMLPTYKPSSWKRLTARARTSTLRCGRAVLGCIRGVCGEFDDADESSHERPVSGWG
jgi:hypothetical protein